MALEQMSLFDGSQKFVIDKPIRLIELFAGFGSQSFALKYLKRQFEHYKICEWAVKSIQAYHDAHFSEDNVDYSSSLSKQEVVDFLTKKQISANYNEPMTAEQILRLGETKQRTIYNNIISTHNLVNIQNVSGEDLEIVDTDKYCYIMTYSFPCQDLSSAGLGKGMEKGGGTRSGLLWEVERILTELDYRGGQNKPQVLLMENVPEVAGTNNVGEFAKWLLSLEKLGYKNYKANLNAKNYGIPQNRERCFMVSILGDYYYRFPEEDASNTKLEDLLEPEVDEKYYLSDRAIKGSLNTKFAMSKLENKIPKDGIVPTILARDYKEPKCIIEEHPKVSIGGQTYDITKNYENYIEWHQPGMLDMDTRAWKTNTVAPTLHTSCGKTKILEKQTLKQQLCNDLIISGKVKENDVIRHSYSSNRMKDWQNRNVESNNMCPTLDTRCDCLGVVVNTNKNDAELPADADNVNFRIRKLTPRECFRLMGVKDEDYEKIAANQSNASLYHLAGDSIVVNVLMAIFRQMF